jgi:putative ATP-dependent endonuclease of the OLD family
MERVEEIGMFIEKIEVENFRSIRSAEVSFSEMTTFIGRNGAGKSTVLYALESFYNVGAQYSHLDYYNHKQTDVSIRIRVTYAELQTDELAEFGTYVHGGKLIVTKIINQGGARYYGSSAQIPEFAEARKLGVRERRTRIKALVEEGKFQDLPALPTGGDQVDRILDEYEAAHPELTVLVDRETQFFGLKNVGGGKLDKFTKFVLVPAVRDAGSEMERRGAIMQLLDLIVTQSINSRQDFQEFRQDFENKARVLYGKENLPELTELGKLVTERLKRYAPGAELLVDFDDLAIPSIAIPEALVTVTEDNFKVPVRYSGHGLQRALILALLEQLSMTRAPSKIAAADESHPPDRLPGLILAIEEPELYLHPARSRYMARILRGLAKEARESSDSKTQIVCVTHSPYFVDVENFDEIRMCRKNLGESHGEPSMSRFTSFTRFQASQKLAEITMRDPKSFTSKSFAARAAPVLNSMVNEGLFADVAVVVEGDSDVVALWAMQESLEARWDELGIVIVPVNGKNNIDRAVVTFEGFGIPTYFVFDGDKVEGKSEATNQSLMRLARQDAQAYPPTGVHARFAVFEDSIEAYLKQVLNTRFDGLRGLCAAEFGHDRPSTALKNSEVMSEFLRRATGEGFDFPVLSQIVAAATALLEPLNPKRARVRIEETPDVP